MTCPTCEGPLCEETRELHGSFVKRSGEVTDTYIERCRFYRGHSEGHSFEEDA